MPVGMRWERARMFADGSERCECGTCALRLDDWSIVTYSPIQEPLPPLAPPEVVIASIERHVGTVVG